MLAELLQEISDEMMMAGLTWVFHAAGAIVQALAFTVWFLGLAFAGE